MSIFTKVRQEHPENIVWENENFFALNDIYPQAKTHVLIIPKNEIETLSLMSEGEKGALLSAVDEVAKKLGLTAYQVQINVNAPYQEIFHVHAHLKSDYPRED